MNTLKEVKASFNILILNSFKKTTGEMPVCLEVYQVFLLENSNQQILKICF